MATVTERRRQDGKVSYLVRWSVGGQRFGRSAPTPGSARRLAVAVEEAAALGQVWRPPSEAVDVDITTVMEAYLRARQRVRRAATVTNDKERLLAWARFMDAKGIKPTAPARSVLSRANIEAFYDWVLTGANKGDGGAGKARKASTAASYAGTIYTMWQWSWEQESWDGQIDRPRPPEIPQQDHAPTVAPSWAECDKVIGLLTKGSATYRVAVAMRLTGLRIGQVIGLRLDDFDLQAKTLTIRGELGKSAQERRGRIVPIPAQLVMFVQEWHRGQASTSSVFDVNPRTVNTLLRRCWVKSGVPENRWKARTAHSFRKAYVTELRQLGADSAAVEYLVGHALPGQIGTYTDPRALKLTEAVALVSRITEGSAAKAPPANG